MAESSTPFSEAVERLGEAAVTNVVDGAALSTAWATALGSATTTPAPDAITDDLARTTMALWMGALRAVAVTAAAVTDAAAIMSYPPNLVAYYSVDLADQLPGRSNPVTLTVTDVAWASPNASGMLPVVSIVTVQPIGVPAGGGPDAVRIRVRPSVATLALVVTVRVDVTGDPDTDPEVLKLRLSPENLDLDP